MFQLTKKEKQLAKTFEAMKAAHYKAWLIECKWRGYPAPCPRCNSKAVSAERGPHFAYCSSCAQTIDDLPGKTWPIKGEIK